MKGGMSISLPLSEQMKFRNWVRAQSAETQKECRVIIIDTTTEFHRNAVRNAPVNKKVGRGNRLRSSIHMVFSPSRLSSTVTANANYAPYQEFGTGNRVRVPAGYETFAWQFKGRGIRKVNMSPQPYFIDAYEMAQKRLIKELNKLGFK